MEPVRFVPASSSVKASRARVWRAEAWATARSIDTNASDQVLNAMVWMDAREYFAELVRDDVTLKRAGGTAMLSKNVFEK